MITKVRAGSFSAVLTGDNQILFWGQFELNTFPSPTLAKTDVNL
jgi:hypothetical protein